MAAVVVSVWLEDQEGETEAKEWVINYMNKGFFEIQEE